MQTMCLSTVTFLKKHKKTVQIAAKVLKITTFNLSSQDWIHYLSLRHTPKKNKKGERPQMNAQYTNEENNSQQWPWSNTEKYFLAVNKNKISWIFKNSAINFSMY